MKLSNKFFAFVLASLFIVNFAGFSQNSPVVIKTPSKAAASVVNVNTIDFKSAFGSSNSALSKLGELISDARRDGDVKALVSAAMILFMEEGLTGKKAAITGKQLLDEATTKAKNQNNAEALLACSDVWGSRSMGNDSKMSTELAKLSAQAKADKAKGLRGPGTKECTLQIENYSTFKIHVYVDDVFMGSVEPGQYIKFAEVGSGTTKLYAETDLFKDPNSGEDTYFYWNGEINLKAYKDELPDFTWQLQ
ncbi:MAG: hypothetical protein IPJ75_05585 [Ignavibacteriales bacterium]|nr:hypothetical protein [Ignavibacteriales bacterium]